MQSAPRSATRRAVGISSRRGVATTTTKAATATASEPGREWVDEKAWVAAMVQREVRAQMLAEEERRTRDRLRAQMLAEEERRTRDRLRAAVADEVELWTGFYSCSILSGWLVGVGWAIMLFGR